MLKEIFKTPYFADEEKNRIANIMNIYVWVGMSLSAIFLPILYFVRGEVIDIVAACCGIVANIVLILMIRSGFVKLATVFVVLSFWGLITFFSFIQDGVSSTAMYGYFAVIPVSGLLLGWRAGLHITIVCVVSGFIMAFFEVAGIAVYSDHEQISPIFRWTVATLFLILAFIIQYLADKSIRRSNEAQEKELAIRLETEKALRESEARNKAFLNANPDLVFLLSDSGVFLDFRAQSSSRILAPDSSFIGRNLKEILPPELAALTMEKISQVRRENRHVIYEYPLSINGKTGYFESRMVPCGDNLMAIIRDITDRRMAEEEKHRMEQHILQTERLNTIGTLAGGIAHDFNNILSGILGYANLMLLKADDSSPFRKPAENIRASAERAGDLVKQILSFSRQTVEDIRPIQMQYIMKDALKLIRETIPSYINIVEKTDPYCRAVMIDATHAYQIITNLCINAFHAMQEKGSGTLTVTLSCHDSDPYNVLTRAVIMLSVADTGTGIAPENIDRIFDPFFTTKENNKGTGLGLSIVKGIISRYGGTITVHSKLGSGTSFDVVLPVAERPAEREIEKRMDYLSNLSGSGRILFVDDEEILVRLGGEMLSALGYSVKTEADPLRALKIIRENKEKFDLLVTDFTMPGIDGVSLIEMAREICPEMPAILCSGTFDDRFTKLKEQKLTEYIQKPIVIEKLASTVKNIIDESKRQS